MPSPSKKKLKTSENDGSLISQLNTNSTEWIIFGLVFFKSVLRQFNNGKDSLFSFDVKDSSGEIRVTCLSQTLKKILLAKLKITSIAKNAKNTIIL